MKNEEIKIFKLEKQIKKLEADLSEAVDLLLDSFIQGTTSKEENGDTYYSDCCISTYEWIGDFLVRANILEEVGEGYYKLIPEGERENGS